MDEWRVGMTLRLAVVVEGKIIQVYLGERMLIEHEVTGRSDLKGEIAFNQMNARARLSNFRFGTLEPPK